tara:strand:+ start:60 stop:1592 length:1533 start_codon:yes stop_codon:yes gene_type:complete
MKKLKNITIVGGGSAAWLAAAYIQHNMWDISLTVIDKEAGNPIGVGEATVLTFPHFLRECGINLTDWFQAVDGTYKAGINFPGWRNPEGSVWHPFYLNRSYPNRAMTQYDVWSQKQDNDFKTHALPTYKVSKENKVDMWGAFETLAYHIDAGKLVNVLQQHCEAGQRTGADFKLIKSDVIDVNRNQHGDVVSLGLANGATHTSDFYIDCTGFASVLKTPKRVELLGEGRLFTNCAVAGHVPYEDMDKECTPYVNCPAVDHGWIWKIPTQSRIGSGMVFNKDITDVETAKQYFSDHWDGRIKPEDMKVIDWVPYYSENFWENNVVSIGLSGGFIEPLESTGLASMTNGVKMLVDRIPQYAYTQADVNSYNNEMAYWYDDAVDYINSHYADTKWDTPFWNYVKETHVKSEKHLFYEAWLKNPQRKFYTNVQSRTLFHPPNWHLWLIQMGYPVVKDLHYINPMEIDNTTNEFVKQEEIRLKTSVTHKDAIDTTNWGTDWWERASQRGDKGYLV